MACPLTPFVAAVMMLCPGSTAVASPAALIVATVVVSEVQVAVAVITWVLSSLRVAVAVNCWVVPSAMAGALGVTAMLSMVAALTVRLALAVCPSKLAVISEFPGASAVASPPVLMVATVVVAEVQVVELVTSWVELSLKVAVAVNCWVVPSAMLEVAGVT